MSGEDTEDHPGLLSRLPVHPVLLAAWPALTLWSSNASEVRAQEAWPYVWMPAAVAALATAVVAPVFHRDPRRAAMATAALAITALFGGRVTAPFGPIVTVGWLLLVVGSVGVAAWRVLESTVASVTATLNVLALVLVALTLPAVIPSLSGEGSSAAEALQADGGTGSDIWYVIPDRYPRADTLTEVFDYDNSPFLDGLRERGFDVGDGVLANYPKTAHSLASTWNLEYLDDLVELDTARGSDWGPLYALLREHTLGRTLQAAGYEYTHLGTWWSPTAQVETADHNVRLDATSEFAVVYLASTVFESLAEVDDTPGATSAEMRAGARDVNWSYSSYQLDALDRLASQSSSQPRFVLAHITQPHEPYVFDRDGSRVTEAEAKSRTREDNILRQVENLNRRLTELVDAIIARDPDAVIVIQSDEGPHPRERTGPSFDWVTASDATLEEKLRILSAIRLPGGPELPDDRTSVNTWRWILNTTIGTDLPILEDRIAVFPGEDSLYTLVDVTDRVD